MKSRTNTPATAKPFAHNGRRQNLARARDGVRAAQSKRVAADGVLKARFTELADRWRRETRNLSSSTDIIEHPAYQKIVDLGERAIPLILGRLHDGSRHWFWALQELSGANPVPKSAEGDLDAMVRAWQRWGRSRAKACQTVC